MAERRVGSWARHDLAEPDISVSISRAIGYSGTAGSRSPRGKRMSQKGNGVQVHRVVYLVDPEPGGRDDLSTRLRELGYRVQPFASGAALLAGVRPQGPCCAVVDACLSGESPVRSFEQLAAAHRELPVVFVAAHGDLATAVDLMRRGAVDFLALPGDAALLRAAVERALARSAALIAERDRRAAASLRLARLTPRERQVLELLWAGQRNREIAVRLDSREATIKVHRSRLMRKLEARSLTEVVRLGLLVQSPARDQPDAAVT